MLVYMLLSYSKFEFSRQITKTRAFVLVFARKTIEFLTAKHWLSLLSVTYKLRRTVLKKGKHRVTGKENSNLLYVENTHTSLS